MLHFSPVFEIIRRVSPVMFRREYTTPSWQAEPALREHSEFTQDLKCAKHSFQNVLKYKHTDLGKNTYQHMYTDISGKHLLWHSLC